MSSWDELMIRQCICVELMQARDEFETSNSDLTVDKLIDTLVQSKTTGTEKPGLPVCLCLRVHVLEVILS